MVPMDDRAFERHASSFKSKSGSDASLRLDRFDVSCPLCLFQCLGHRIAGNLPRRVSGTRWLILFSDFGLRRHIFSTEGM